MYIRRLMLFLKIWSLIWLFEFANCQASSGGNKLTDQLAGDSDTVASVLGENEAIDLVNEALRRVKEKRNKADLKSHSAEIQAEAATKTYEASLTAAQNYITQSHEFKSRLSHLAAAQTHYSHLTHKTEEIAERMRQLAEQAEARLQVAKSMKNSIQAQIAEATAVDQVSRDRKEFARLYRSHAEQAARKASQSLARLDLTISQLLGQRSWLKEVEAAEDRTASTRL